MIQDHEDIVHVNKKGWQQNKCLQRVYTEFHKQIQCALTTGANRSVIEIGAGMASIKNVIPHCICTDTFARTELDRTEDIYKLSSQCNDATDFILFDVFHHLEFPGDALAQMYTKLQPGGRVILFEPYISIFSFFVYGIFHHEPVAFCKKITWKSTCKHYAGTPKYYAAEANPTRIFCSKRYRGLLTSDWNIVTISVDSAIRYLGTGGFSGTPLYPKWAYSALTMVDRLLSFAPRLFGSRVLIVLEKKC